MDMATVAFRPREVSDRDWAALNHYRYAIAAYQLAHAVACLVLMFDLPAAYYTILGAATVSFIGWMVIGDDPDVNPHITTLVSTAIFTGILWYQPATAWCVAFFRAMQGLRHGVLAWKVNSARRALEEAETCERKITHVG